MQKSTDEISDDVLYMRFYSKKIILNEMKLINQEKNYNFSTNPFIYGKLSKTTAFVVSSKMILNA